MQKNETLTAVADGYTFEGAGVVHDEGFPVFVPGLLDGEKAEIAVTAVKKGYAFGRIVKLLEPSVHRRLPQCSVYRACGGCQLLHMDTEEQHRFKEDKVRHCFLMNAGMEIDVLPILYTAEQTGYRNKVQVPVQWNKGKVKMGFYRPRSNDIVEFDHCLVQTELSNRLVQSFRKWIEELHCATMIRHVLIRDAHRSGEVMICFVIRQYPFAGLDQLVKRIEEAYSQVKSISCIVNRREDNVILDGKEVLLSGDGVIREELLGKSFEISARSFFQINPYATEILYCTAIERAGLTGKEVVIDLYCGTGTIGILAAEHAGQVYGIEIVKEAIEDAKRNARRNHVENISFMAADANAGAQQLLKKHVQPDVVIVDPPRKGCSKDTLDAIVRMNPERLVYVSCDPSTLARDCRYMSEQGYRIQSVQPVDMFPGTVHIENVVLLQRGNS